MPISKQATHLLFPGIQDFEAHGGNRYTANFVNDESLQVWVESTATQTSIADFAVFNIKPYEYVLWVDDNYLPGDSSSKGRFFRSEDTVVVVAKSIRAFMHALDKLGPPKRLYMDYNLSDWAPPSTGMQCLFHLFLNGTQPEFEKDKCEIIPISDDSSKNEKMQLFIDEQVCNDE